MKPSSLVLALLVVAAALEPARAQSVAVTMALDAPSISAGQTTTLHVYAQVVPGLRANSDRIFSWYVDVLNGNGGAAAGNYDSMQKPASDRDPQTSSTGVSQGANRRGIYDTFLNLPGAGTSNRVELMSIPVAGVAAGSTRFSVQAGSGAALSADFQVISKDGTQIFTGGDYSLAFADLTVTGSGTGTCTPQLQIARVGAGGPNGTLQLTFTPCAGANNTVEARGALLDVTGWVALPGAPHNSGSVSVTNTTTQRFFRVRVSP